MKKFLPFCIGLILIFAVTGCTKSSGTPAASSESAAETTTETTKTTAETTAETTEQTIAEETPIEPANLIGSWLQTDSNDPYLLSFYEDGVFIYYATNSHEADYFSMYVLENDILTLTLIYPDRSDVTEIPYQVNFKADPNRPFITLTADPEAAAAAQSVLLGMESAIAGNYQRLSFSDDELNRIKQSLSVPDDLEVTIGQSEPQYWSAGERWLTTVSIYDTDSRLVAGASVDSMTLELCKDIFQYSGE